MDRLASQRNVPIFNGQKYGMWKFRVRALLTELKVIKVIDKPIPEMVDDAWTDAELTAKSVIISVLGDSYISFAGDDTTAKEILNKLDETFERKSAISQLSVRRKLTNFMLKPDTSLTEHLMMYEDLINQLKSTGCPVTDNEKIAMLLNTFPSTYDSVIVAIETISEKDLNYDVVKTRLIDYETKLKKDSSDTSAKVLQFERNIESIMKRDNKNRFNNNNNKYFKNYDKRQFKHHNNHTNKFNKNNGHAIKLKCHQCVRRGHFSMNCFHYNNSIKYKKNGEHNRTVQTAEVNESSESYDSIAFMMTNNQKTTQSTDKTGITFILDSGATDHITNREDIGNYFKNLQSPIKILVAKNGVFVHATKRGSLDVITNLGLPVTLENVLYCPEVPYNLLSVRRMQEAGLGIYFDKNGVSINKLGKIIMTGMLQNKLLDINFIVNTNRIAQYSSTVNKLNYELWHQRLGHISKNKFLELKNNNMIEDLDQIKDILPNDNLCEPCINGKQARLPFNKSKNKKYINRPLLNLHSDVAGPITPTTINNKNYFVVFIDEYTHYCVTYLITYKSDVFSVFKDIIAKSEARFNFKIVNLYIDNGREYLSSEMKNYCVEKGITFHLTVPRTPQQNGVAERMIRTITEKARSMIAGAKLNKVFWGEAVLTATYLINLSPTKALKNNKTPYEMWHSKKPQIKNLRVFGSTVYIHNKIRKTKFDEKSIKSILVGYEPNGYKVWDVVNEKFTVVRDVIFDETGFMNTRPAIDVKGINDEKSQDETDVSDIRSKSVVEEQKSDVDKSDELEPSKKNAKINSEFSKPIVEDDKYLESLSGIDRNVKPESSGVKRSERIRNRPVISYEEFDIPDECLICAKSLVCSIPTSYKEIKNREDRVQWEQAIQDEINSLLINKTWDLIPKPVNKNIVDCKWVFTIKNDEHGNPFKYKARLVARGFSQEYLTDYNETFAPVARISSFRFILAFANQNNLLVHHMDVKTAFLNGTLKEEIYMRVPEGVSSKNNQVCKLNKALYGLKQAARCWFETFEKALIEKGFRNSPVDRCIYMLDRGNISKNIYVILYVDDLVITTGSLGTMSSFKNYLMNKFSMVDLRDIKLFLGIKITRSENTITLDQSAYIKTILDKYNMLDCNPINTPLESKLNYIALNSDEKYDSPCRNLVGCLMYVMLCTRPDLSTAVNILSRFLNKNNIELWKCLKRVLRYLKGSIDIKLRYIKSDFDDLLCGYVDSDWGGNDATDRKSTTGYLFKLFENCTICWSTRKQLSVAASSTEAEYMALFEGVREALWLKSLAVSIKINISKPIIIYEDNNGCISIANNPTSHKRSKHIDIKYHFSREQIEKNEIKLIYIPTGQQLADVLTKPLPAVKFLELRNGLGLR